MLKFLEPPTYYPLNSNPKGRILVLNNKKFKKNTSRDGSKYDVASLRDLGKALDYPVEVVQDKTVEEMEEELNDFAKRAKDDELDSVLVFIMSHGNEDSIEDRKGNTLSRQKIIHAFEILENKPKLFFFQACRGSKAEPSDSKPNDSQSASFLEKLKRALFLGTTLTSNASALCGTNAAVRDTKLSYLSDALIADATAFGRFSWDSGKEGSYFIQAICQIFCKYRDSPTMTITDLLGKVHERTLDLMEGQEPVQIQDPDVSKPAAIADFMTNDWRKKKRTIDVASGQFTDQSFLSGQFTDLDNSPIFFGQTIQ
uniref:Uncharacterized protein n=1 Tax=Plectus sambesii TaxID=2011161 RepID=A0A914XKQ3_9BILA